MRGRKPKPTALKILDGDREDRINRDEPVLPPASEEMPNTLATDEARQCWAELSPLLAKAGLLSEGDRHALSLLCEAYSLTRADPLDYKARDLYRRMLIEFGLTPSSRSRIKATVEKPKDQLDEFMKSFQTA